MMDMMQSSQRTFAQTPGEDPYYGLLQDEHTCLLAFKLGHQCKNHKEWAALQHCANQLVPSLRLRPNFTYCGLTPVQHSVLNVKT